jgi:hypothetical protein
MDVQSINTTHAVGPNSKSFATALSDASAGDELKIIGDVSISADQDITTPDLRIYGSGQLDLDGNIISVNADNISIEDVSITTATGDRFALILLATSTAISDVAIDGVTLDANTQANHALKTDGTTYTTTDLTVRDSEIKNADAQSNISLQAVDGVTVENNRFENAGRSHVFLFENVRDVTVSNNYMGAWMQRDSNPDGPVRLYGNGYIDDIEVSDNRIVTGATDQGKGYDVLNAQATSGTVVYEGNDIDINTPDVNGVMTTGDRGGTQCDTVTFRSNTVVVNSNVANIYEANQARKVVFEDNDITIDSAVTFRDRGGRFDNITHLVVRDEDVDNFVDGQFIGGAATKVTFDSCRFAGMANELVEVFSGPVNFISFTNNHLTATGNACLSSEDAFSYLTIADNYLETDQTSAIAGEGNSNVTEEIHNNHRNTA